MTDHRNIVFHQGALGDFLLALPVIEGLWRASRDLRLDFWSRQAHLALLYGKPYVGATFDAGGPEWLPFFQDDAGGDPPLPRGVDDAQRIWIFGQDSSARVAERLRSRAQAPTHWIQSFPGEGQKQQHTTDFLEAQVRSCGQPLVMEPLCLIPDPRELGDLRERIGRSWLEDRRRLVVVHPGSGGLRKIWPLPRWGALMQWLGGWGDVQVLLVLGPADGRIRSFVSEWEQRGRVGVLEGLSLPALAALLSMANLYIGNDSGVTHLAAATGAPVVAVFGPTNPVVWGPRGPEISVYEDSWSAEEILAPLPSERARLSVDALSSIIRRKLETPGGRG